MPRSHELHEVPTVFVVDPDPSTGRTTRELLNGSEVGCELYESGTSFSLPTAMISPAVWCSSSEFRT